MSAPRRGLDGALLRAWRAQDLRLRVIDRQEVAASFLRLQVDVGDLLHREDVYPTYWLRLWFTRPDGKGHQRAYTLVDPDPGSGTAWIEFYLHPGIASDWARAARPGDEIDASILNGRSPVASDPPHLLLIGDGASVPAIADTLRRAPGIPATVLLERGRPDDEEVLPLPRREGASIAWFDRDGSIEAAALAAAASAPAGTVCVVALEAAGTRAVGRALRTRARIPKEHLHALAYWRHS
ncbi:side tail fiber protein [Brachybacterium phenoliresistens]|uniref:Side tail fiber protein n=1 Tax=Brachybacterium phenoliresistens TaxID=396014 RepID=Z9JPW1_9MICO|nr:side tail fiber protein [Brachybacterium phenoliresistens]